MAADFTVFGQLVRALVPQARVVAIFDCDGQLSWTSEGIEPASAASNELRSLATDLVAGSAGGPTCSMRCILDSGASYAFLVRDLEGVVIGTLTLAVAGPFRSDEVLLPETLAERIAPLLVLLAQDLQRALAMTTMQLKLLDVSAQDASAETVEPGVDPIERLLSTLVGTLRADLAIACLPGHQFEQRFSRPNSPFKDIDALSAVMRTDLIRRAELEGKALSVKKARTGPNAPPFRFVSVPLRRHGSVVGVLVVFAAIGERQFEERDVERAARSAARLVELVESRVDRATGLPTRAVLEDHVAAVASSDTANHCLVYIDIDQMHALNNLFGFDVGDDVLLRLAALNPGGKISQTGSAGGIIGRLSGDRFAAVLDRCTLNHGRVWAETMRDRVEQLPLPPGCEGFRLSASFGVAAIAPGERFEMALARATTAGRAAKDRGRNRVEVFANTDLSLVQRQDDLQLFRELCMAIEARRFRLLAHAIVPLADPTAPTHYEILMRLVDSKGALLEPGRFMSAAKRYQLLPQLDKGVIELALSQLEPYVPLLEARRSMVWINITGSTLGQTEVADAIRILIKRSGIPGHMLGFEITENAAIENLDAATRFIQRVRELGCKVALDDFGTGFSSLAYLKSLAVQSIKIDGSFVRDLLGNGRSQALVSAVLEIARQLGLDTVAEFVESADVAVRLKALGVTYGQGHLYGKPAPLREVLSALAEEVVPTPALQRQA